MLIFNNLHNLLHKLYYISKVNSNVNVLLFARTLFSPGADSENLNFAAPLEEHIGFMVYYVSLVHQLLF